MSLADFRREPLLFGPSPVHRLPRLSEALGGQVEIWAKREDCNSGIAFGGNKVRKLEYLAAEAIDTGCDTLVSIGGIQSNHTRQVTGVACHLGLKAVTVQEGWVDYGDLAYDKVGNIQLTRIMGGDIRIDPAGFDIGMRDSWKRAIDSVVEAGGKPYPIPAGASDHPLGGLGFASWAVEVEAQEAELDTFFDTVIVCTVTGSSHAGMIAGFALSDRPGRRVIGIDASATLEQTSDAGTPHRERHRGQDRPRSASARRRDHRGAGLRGAGVRPPGRGHRRGDPPRRAHRGDAHRPRLRGEVDGRADRDGPLRRDPRRLAGPLLPPRRPARPVGVRRLPRPRLARSASCRTEASGRQPATSRHRLLRLARPGGDLGALVGVEHDLADPHRRRG